MDGRAIVASSAVGKHLLLEFEGERTLHVHLGLYGSWDFAGQVNADPTFRSSNGRMGQTNLHETGPTPAGIDATRSGVAAEPVGTVTRSGTTASTGQPSEPASDGTSTRATRSMPSVPVTSARTSCPATAPSGTPKTVVVPSASGSWCAA